MHALKTTDGGFLSHPIQEAIDIDSSRLQELGERFVALEAHGRDELAHDSVHLRRSGGGPDRRGVVPSPLLRRAPRASSLAAAIRAA
jgi:hypothetical protein